MTRTGQLGCEEEGEPGKPGSGPRGESWGAGRLGVARVRGRREAEGGRGLSEGVEERQGRHLRILLRKAAIRERSAPGVLGELWSVGPVETLNSLGRNGSALPPTAGLGWEIQDWPGNP